MLAFSVPVEKVPAEWRVSLYHGHLFLIFIFFLQRKFACIALLWVTSSSLLVCIRTLILHVFILVTASALSRLLSYLAPVCAFIFTGFLYFGCGITAVSRQTCVVGAANVSLRLN